jgi:hypothetical protein
LPQFQANAGQTLVAKAKEDVMWFEASGNPAAFAFVRKKHGAVTQELQAFGMSQPAGVGLDVYGNASAALEFAEQLFVCFGIGRTGEVNVAANREGVGGLGFANERFQELVGAVVGEEGAIFSGGGADGNAGGLLITLLEAGAIDAEGREPVDDPAPIGSSDNAIDFDADAEPGQSARSDGRTSADLALKPSSEAFFA